MSDEDNRNLQERISEISDFTGTYIRNNGVLGVVTEEGRQNLLNGAEMVYLVQ